MRDLLRDWVGPYRFVSRKRGGEEKRATGTAIGCLTQLDEQRQREPFLRRGRRSTSRPSQNGLGVCVQDASGQESKKSVLVSFCCNKNSPVFAAYKNEHVFLARGSVGCLWLCWAQPDLAPDRWKSASVSSHSRA